VYLWCMQNELILRYESFSSQNELSEDEQHYIKKAFEGCDKSYSPYSKFKVGACVVLENGEFIVGSNQENIAYPSGLCAERTVLFYAGASFPDIAIKALVIVAKGDFIPADAKLSPCGSCRQVMAENQLRQTALYPILLVNMDGSITKFSSIHSLLPFVFG
jgi:cytidine deaminase